MARELHDNYLSTFKQVVTRVAESGIRGLTTHSQARIAHALETNEVDPYLSLEFRRAGTDITLYVRMARASVGDDGDRIQDDAGNVWIRMDLRTEINWPSLGHAGSGAALARLGFYHEVAQLAAEIEAEIRGPIYSMVATAEEAKEREARIEAARRARELKAIVEGHTRGMRVGRTISLAFDKGLSAAGITDGEHEVEERGKRYSVAVTGGATRLAITRRA